MTSEVCAVIALSLSFKLEENEQLNNPETAHLQAYCIFLLIWNFEIFSQGW